MFTLARIWHSCCCFSSWSLKVCKRFYCLMSTFLFLLCFCWNWHLSSSKIQYLLSCFPWEMISELVSKTCQLSILNCHEFCIWVVNKSVVMPCQDAAVFWILKQPWKSFVSVLQLRIFVCATPFELLNHHKFHNLVVNLIFVLRVEFAAEF